ncbi:hypothetical protein FA15DRAFT_64738 [Coprinopsis marcescibilis]|uniref:Uncharacterized protein n=1 Tax=Coprinopsis marcescibilis TaxID=230819 RepID=A0A5C3KNF7_COPMA|nr:hypothetical protein FA15DRAFT_64738 [Coprinopsis marcescibilis]
MDFSPDDIPPGLSGFERIVPEYDSERLAVGAERTAARQMNQQSNVGGSELAGGSLATSEAGSGVTAKADVSGTETTANGRGQTNSEERAATVATLKDHGTAIEDIKALSSVSPTGQEVDSTSTKQKKRKRNSGDGEGNETSRGLGEPITHGSYFPMVPVGQPRRQRFHNTPKVPKPKKKKVKLVDELDASSAASSAGPGSGTGSGAQGGTNDSPAKPKPKRISKLKEVFTGNVGESPAVDLAASGSTISESQSPEKPIRKRKKVTFAPSQVSPEENGGDVVAVASGSRVTQGEPSVSTAEGTTQPFLILSVKFLKRGSR